MKQEPWPARAENPRPSGRGEVNIVYRTVNPDAGIDAMGSAEEHKRLLDEQVSYYRALAADY